MAKTTFGRKVKRKTPFWALWMFRITFLLTTCATAYFSATDLFSEPIKYEITLILKVVVDPVVFFLSKMFDIKENQLTNEPSHDNSNCSGNN